MAVLLSPALSSQELDSLVNIMKNEGTTSKWSATEIQTAKDTSVQTDTNEAVNVFDIPEAPEAPGLPDNVLHESEPSPEVQVIEEDVEFEFDDGPEYVFENDNRDDGNASDDERKHHSRFKGHWAGAEIGLNNYFDEDFSLQRDGDSWYMDIKTGRSMVVGFNFAQYSVGIIPGHAGLVTGMGITFNNYFFDNDISLVNNNGVIETVNLAGDNYVRSKLAVISLRVPLLFEIQFPGFGRDNSGFISAGLTGSLRLDSHTKVVYKEGKEKTKDKNWDDFNLNSFRYGLTFRIGSGDSNIFVDYDITPLFAGDANPVLYPFSFGFAATF